MRALPSLLKFLAAAVLCAISATALASDFPSRPIRIVSTAAPGGAFDVAGRIVSERMAKALGGAIAFENRQGAVGVLAGSAVATAQPDGYTWLFSNESLFTMANHPAHTQRDQAVQALVPMSLFATVPLALAVHPSLDVRTVAELISYARQNPDKLKYGSPGSVFKAGMEMLSQPEVLPLFEVPYKSTPQALNALLAGEIDTMMIDPSAAKQFAASGQVRVLAVTSRNALPLLPGVPPVSATVPGYRVEVWSGLFAPKGVDPAIMAAMDKALRTSLNDPAVQQALANAGIVGTLSASAEEFVARIAMERQRNAAAAERKAR